MEKKFGYENSRRPLRFTNLNYNFQNNFNKENRQLSNIMGEKSAQNSNKMNLIINKNKQPLQNIINISSVAPNHKDL